MRLLAFLALALSSTLALADKPTDLLKQAKAHFDLQEYEQAETLLKEAYKLDPKPEILYALAQAQRMAGECDKAAVSYKNFLRTNPPAAQAKLAEDNITRCTPKPEPKPAPPPAPPPPPPPKPVAPPPPTPPHITHHAGASASANWTGRLLIAGGALVVAGGGALAYTGQQTIDDIDSAKFYDDFVTRSKNASSAKTERTVGLVVGGAGVAAIVAGVISYVVRSPDKETVTVGPHGELSLAWSF